jgi:transposase
MIIFNCKLANVCKFKIGVIVVSNEEFFMIHELYKRGNSIRNIAKILNIDRRTIAKRLKEVALLPVTRNNKQSKLEPYKTYITNRISKVDKRIPSEVILREIKEIGYNGKLRILQEFLTLTYADREPADPIVRFETDPGVQVQVDWTTIRSGNSPIYAFVATLGYSRVSFVYFTNNMETITFIECHKLAFTYFGGVPKHILYDNLKSVVIERNFYGKGLHKFNNDFLDFAKLNNFKPRLCKPYRAKTKGKVERFNSYLKGNFYYPLVGKLKDAGIIITDTILNNYITTWLEIANNRVHGTTHEQPFMRLKEEVKHLQAYVQLVTPTVLPKASDAENKVQVNVPEVFVLRPNLSLYDQLLGVQ